VPLDCFLLACNLYAHRYKCTYAHTHTHTTHTFIKPSCPAVCRQLTAITCVCRQLTATTCVCRQLTATTCVCRQLTATTCVLQTRAADGSSQCCNTGRSNDAVCDQNHRRAQGKMCTTPPVPRRLIQLLLVARANGMWHCGPAATASCRSCTAVSHLFKFDVLKWRVLFSVVVQIGNVGTDVVCCGTDRKCWHRCCLLWYR
jgi:hypothetical protein